MFKFIFKHPEMTQEILGFLPVIFNENDRRPAKEQINDRYAHGGGYRPMKGWFQTADGTICYDGDEPILTLAEGKLGNEIIRVHESSWVSITQPNGEFVVTRMD